MQSVRMAVSVAASRLTLRLAADVVLLLFEDGKVDVVPMILDVFALW